MICVFALATNGGYICTVCGLPADTQDQRECAGEQSLAEKNRAYLAEQKPLKCCGA